MAVFGAPLPQPDHAHRGIACAQALVSEGLPAFDRWVSAQGIAEQFDVGVGPASGALRSGNVGSPDRVEYTAIGDATNTAARLQSRARDAGVTALIAASVLTQLARPAPGLIDAGLHSLPGKDQPVRAHTFVSQEAQGASLPASTLAE
jgi:adenylate cyclase